MKRDIRFKVRTLEAPRVAVKVRRKGNDFIVDPEIHEPVIVAKAGTKIFPLEEPDHVVDPAGNLIPATGKFYCSAETIDPFHLIFDLF